MSSMRKIQDIVDEIYTIKESTAELNEEIAEKVEELIDHQKEFINSTSTKLSKINNTFKDNIERANYTTRNLKDTCNDAIARTENFIKEVEQERQDKLEKFYNHRKRILISTIVLGFVSIFFICLNYYLGKKSYAKYSAIQGMPTTTKYKGEYYVKIKPRTESTWTHQGKDVTFAKMA